MKELDNTVLSTGMAHLSQSLSKMTNVQVIFCFQHMMRKYTRDPIAFDMEFEAADLYQGFIEGEIPGGKNKQGEFKHDWHTVKSMREAGYWMAHAGETIIDIAWNNGNLKRTSPEIMEELQNLVEGSTMSASQRTKSKLLNSILRLAGFEDHYARRVGEAGSKRMWRTADKEDKLEDCLVRYREAINKHIDIWS